MSAHSLSGRLMLAYTAALVLGLIVFAVLFDVLLDRAYAAMLDQRLHSVVEAIGSIADSGGDRIDLDQADRKQFRQVVGVKLDGALFQSNGTVMLSTSSAVSDELRELARSDRETDQMVTVRSRDAGGGTIRVATKAIMHDGRRVGAALVWYAYDPIDDIDHPATIAFAIAIPIIVALAMFAGSIVTRRGLAPLRALADIAGDIEAHDLNRRLRAPKGDDELGRLCATFDRMLDRLQSAFERQRRFTADASHELRAPLSVIRAEADLALRKPRDGQEYRRALETISAETDRLQTLIGDLLAVARADEGGTSKAVDIDLSDLARVGADRLLAVAEAKGVQLRMSLQPRVSVFADADALGRVPIVLVDNAVRFSPAGGHVEITVEGVGAEAVMRVRDEGPGFSLEGLERATSRFWREDSARVRGGSGLGLAIARAIVEQAHGKISLANTSGGGAEVTVRLPLAR